MNVSTMLDGVTVTEDDGLVRVSIDMGVFARDVSLDPDEARALADDARAFAAELEQATHD